MKVAPGPDRSRVLSLRPATPSDERQITDLVLAAYSEYVDRIGRKPGPMTDDYGVAIRSRPVTVAEVGAEIVGVVVLDTTDEGFLLENVAVHPGRRRAGIGAALLGHAETAARRAGFDSLYLYTHELMSENLAYYARHGYVEFDRRAAGEFSRVYLRKSL